MNTTETDRQGYTVAESFPALRLLYTPGCPLNIDDVRPLRIGRNELGRKVAHQHWSLPDDNRLSRLHAVLTVGDRGTEPVIADCQSKNGTFVNGVSTSHQVLRDGDLLRLGNSFFLVRWLPAMSPEAILPELVGVSPLANTLRQDLLDIAPQAGSVLLLGETGTGKEVAARALHRLSGRPGPFVAVNCAAIPESLAESQLFGHIAGAFSGARTAHDGYFRAAQGGSLFLDEIGELPLPLQAKLLRVLEERTVTPVGATRSLPVDIRLISATNRPLPAEASRASFRADLYARLAVHIIHLPLLQKRREDLLPLLQYALNPLTPRLSPRLLEALLLYHWPLNVRELIHLATSLRRRGERGEELDLPHVVERLLPISAPVPVPTELPAEDAPEAQRPQTRTPLTKEVLLRLLEEHHGVIARVAAAAGRSRRHVRRLISQFQVDKKIFTDP